MRVRGLSSYYRFDQRTAHGGVGDPRLATAEKGERMLDASAGEIAEQISEIRALEPLG
jgi:creatinine amidohydrolase/Fe(II)-dependent formamide hydrolase-like protein